VTSVLAADGCTELVDSLLFVSCRLFCLEVLCGVAAGEGRVLHRGGCHWPAACFGVCLGTLAWPGGAATVVAAAARVSYILFGRYGFL
jgi:hypothetical protein